MTIYTFKDKGSCGKGTLVVSLMKLSKLQVLNFVKFQPIPPGNNKWMFSCFVITRNGEDWYTLRKSVQKLMMHPRAAAKYLDAQSEVADDFLDIIRVKCRADGEVEGFYNLLLQYTMECKSFTIVVI